MEVQEEKNRKIWALVLLFALFLIYKETVLDVHYPAKKPGDAEVSQTPVAQKAPSTTLPAAMPLPKMDSPAAPPVPTPASAPTSTQHSIPSDAEVAQGGKIVVHTDAMEVHISRLGGRVTELLLQDFAQTVEEGSARLNLVSHVEGIPFPLGVYSGEVNDSRVAYDLKSLPAGASEVDGITQVGAAEGSPVEVELLGYLPDGREITKRFTFEKTGHFFDVDVSLSAPAPNATRLRLEWTKQVPEAQSGFLDRYRGYVWFDGQKAHRESFDIDEDQKEFAHKQLGPVIWATFADHYFMVSLLSQQAEALAAEVVNYRSFYRLLLNGSEKSVSARLFAGPKSYRMLENLGSELKRNIDFGFTSVIAVPLLFLLNLFYSFFGNYGVAIVALTIIVKAVLFPLNAAQFKQMREMQRVAPEMKRIKETIKDKQEQQKAMMELYKKEGVNPLGSCLPILVQMPIFIGLYMALAIAIELRHEPFALWIQDLSMREQLMIGGVGVPVMVILMVISMVVQQWLTPTQSMEKSQRYMMMIAMPIVFGFLFSSFPAGLTLYWLTSNLLSIAQQKAQQKGPAMGIKITSLVAAGLLVFALVLTKI